MSTRPKRTSAKPRRPRAAADPVTAYARQVVAGEILTGRPVRLACERHLRDLKRKDLVWDLAAATRAIKFFSDVLRLNGGEFEGLPFDLTPSPTPQGGHWQAFVVGSLFGWKKPNKRRRFRVAYIEIAKGNGKSPLAAGVGHYMLSADDEPRAEVYSAASKKDQAMILFRDAVAMRDQSPALSKRLTKSGTGEKAWNLGYPAKGSFFRPISSDDGQSGPRPHCGLIDELHEHKTSTVVDMMRAGTKSRRQALIFEITNAGWDRTTVCWNHHEYSLKVLEGTAENDHWFGYIATLDACDECRAKGKTGPDRDCEACDKWIDESVWVKANPNLGVSIGLDYLREQVREAQGMPTKENNVRRLNFTEWTEQETIWIPSDAWLACGASEAITWSALRGRACFFGLDLSSSDDLTALAAWFPPAAEGEPHKVIVEYWIPGDNVAARAEATQMPYDLWVQRNLVHSTQGTSIEYAAIRKRIGEIRDDYQLQVVEIPYDPSGALQLAQELSSDGFTPVEIRQTTKFFDPVMKYFEALVKNAGLRHHDHPVTNWHLSNVAPRIDSGGQRPDKERSRNKIDGAVAMLMACGRAMVKVAEPASVYETRGILTS